MDVDDIILILGRGTKVFTVDIIPVATSTLDLIVSEDNMLEQTRSHSLTHPHQVSLFPAGVQWRT